MEIISGRYKISTRKLGTGGFSEVFLGIDMETNKRVAIKKVSLTQRNLKKEQTLEKLNLEIDLMRKLKHTNIVEFYDVIKMDTDWYIIMEYCNAGTLENVIKFNKAMDEKKAIKFNREANTYYYLAQLKDALDYLRKSDHVHRDIKPMNILLVKEFGSDSLATSLDDYGTIFKSDEQLDESIEITNFDRSEKIILKLADFGLAKAYSDDNDSLMNTLCGSPLYMAPELLIGNKYTSKADLWSYGVIMYELLFGEHPTPAVTLPQLVSAVKSKSIDFHNEKNFTHYCFDLLTRLLVKNQEERIEWHQFFNHKWFVYWEKKVSEGEDPSIELEHSRELPTSYDRIVIGAVSTPIKSNIDDMSLYQKPSSIPLDYPNKSLELSGSEKMSVGISPLGLSNLSRMKTDSIYYKSYVQGTYSDYPSSYPPEKKTTQPLATSVRRITSTSHFFHSPTKQDEKGPNHYSESYNDSPQSRIFKHVFTDTSKEEPINSIVIEDYHGRTVPKSEPIDIKKQSVQNRKK